MSARSRLRDEPSIEVNAAEYFSPTNGEVVPPVLERPQLPSEPPPNVPPENVGTLELYVNEEGLVDRVRLVSPANRYNERMIVAAAKAWRFRPAFRDGQPVKYRTIIRVTL